MKEMTETQTEHLGAEALFRQHARSVARFFGRLGFRGSDVDDLVQEVFLVAHRQGGYVPGPARPSTWLTRIAVRIAMATRRQRSRLPVPTERIDDEPGNQETPLDRSVNQQLLHCLAEAMDSLPMDHRLVLVLFEFEGQSCHEIAQTLNIPIGTVYSRLHEARQSLQLAYDKRTAPPKAPVRLPAHAERRNG